jgi:hypothetical protein
MGFLDRSEKLWVVSHVFINDVDKVLTARRNNKCVEEVKRERARRKTRTSTKQPTAEGQWGLYDTPPHQNIVHISFF